MKKTVLIIIGLVGLISVLSYAFFFKEEESGYTAKPKEKENETLTDERIVSSEKRDDELEEVKRERQVYEDETPNTGKVIPPSRNSNSFDNNQKGSVANNGRGQSNFNTKPKINRFQPLKVKASLATRKTGNITSTQWMPSFRLIKCRTVNTSQSIFSNTPLIAMTTEDVYHHGVLIIPKNTEIHGKLSGGRQTNRATGAGGWTLVFDDGRELTLNAQVLHRGESKNLELEMSAGLVGEIKARNPDEYKKIMMLTGLQGALEGVKERSTNALGNETENGGFKNAGLNAFSKPVEKWLDQQFQRIGSDPYFLEVRGGTAFYLYTMNPLDIANAKIGGKN